MAKKSPGKLAPMAISAGTQVGAFAGTAIASEGIAAGIDAMRPDSAPLSQNVKGAIAAGTGLGLGGLALIGKSTRKYAGTIIGGGVLKAVIDWLPGLRALGAKIGGMIKKPAGSGARRPRGSQGTGRQTDPGVRADSRVRDLIN